jgi:hypothetical protein
MSVVRQKQNWEKKMKKRTGTVGFAVEITAGLLAASMCVQAADLHFNIGEMANGQETIGGKVWNNTTAGTFSAIQDADGVEQVGVSINVAMDAAKSGCNPKDKTGPGYVSGLDSMGTSLAFAFGRNNRTIVNVYGLGANTAWDLDLYAGLDMADRSQTISVNGAAPVLYNGQTVYASHAPIPFKSVGADSSGNLTIELVGTGTVTVSYIQGLTLKRAGGSSPASSPSPVPLPSSNVAY